MKIININVDNIEYDLTLSIHKYSNKRTAIKLIDAEDGFPFMSLSHNFPDYPDPEEGYFYAKYWSENYDIFMELLKNKIVIAHKKETDSFYFSNNLLNSIKPMQFKIADEYLVQEPGKEIKVDFDKLNSVNLPF